MAKLLAFSSLLILDYAHGWNDCKSRSFDTATQSLQTSRCTELDLSHAQALSGATDPRFQSFLQALSANVNVRKVEMENLELDDNMVKALVDALIDRSVDLYSLEITNQNFGDDGADAIAAFLAKTSSLRSLSLARNHIGDVGVTSIANALPPSLHELDLSWNSIGDTGVEALLQAVIQGSMIRELELDHNRITDDGAEIVYTVLTTSKSDYLRELDILDNPMTDQGLRVLQDASQGRAAAARPVKIKLPRHIWSEATGGHRPRQPARAVPLKRKPAASNWTEQQVKDWVRDLHPTFKSYANAFVSNAVNGEVLLSLTEDDLATMGIDNKLHCKRIVAEIKKMAASDEL
eukprot:m.32678 g.32678  ORF g.32678 m.32678 type:complete len:349 (-) comp12170_c0_seq2:121-1167(-)